MTAAESQRQPVLVFFHAQWCGACQHTKQNLMDNIRQVSAANGVKVVEADVDVATIELAESAASGLEWVPIIGAEKPASASTVRVVMR